MKMILSSLATVAVVAVGSLVMAQTGGGEKEVVEGHAYGYGMMGGHGGWWVAYCALKIAVVVFVLWLFLRITRALEIIAAARK